MILYKYLKTKSTFMINPVTQEVCISSADMIKENHRKWGKTKSNIKTDKPACLPVAYDVYRLHSLSTAESHTGYM